ncbi:DUF3429 domain-containing protein [Paraburkholderia bryophila]|uniref:DUF3429 domain-containing protein n=1 Tax=Paraburkholderia bryophila TaxID=420952 RepID=UPI003AF1DD26
MSHRSATNGLPQFLGYAGLVPFIALALMVRSFGAHQEFLRNALLSYGACIVSFLGAVHWGLWLRFGGTESAATRGLVWSVIPSIAAWVVLASGVQSALPAMAALLVCCLLVDIHFGRSGILPKWYVSMRILLTATGAICLLAASN